MPPKRKSWLEKLVAVFCSADAIPVSLCSDFPLSDPALYVFLLADGMWQKYQLPSPCISIEQLSHGRMVTHVRNKFQSALGLYQGGIQL